MNLRTTVCLIMTFYSGVVLLPAQEPMLQSVSDQLDFLVDEYVHNSISPDPYFYDTSALSMIFSPGQIDSAHFRVEENERLAEIKYLESDNGLDFQSSYVNTLAGSLLEDDGSFYKWRTQAGIGWNMLRDGWLANKHKVKEKELDWQAAKNLRQLELRKQGYRQMYNHIIYAFNVRKIEVIEDRLLILNDLLDGIRKLHALHYAHWEDVLDVLSARTETELILDNYITYVSSVQLDSGLQSNTPRSLPVFDLAYEEIEMRGPDTLAQFRAMEQHLAALDHQFHWSRKISLNARINYSYYVGGAQSTYDQRDYVAGGINLGIPISFNQKSRNELIEARESKIRSDYQHFQDGLQNDVLNHYYEFQYAMKQYVNFHYKKEKIVTDIRRSIRKRNLSDPDYSPKKVITRLDEFFGVEIELLDIQQKMYLKALKIFHLIDAEDIRDFIRIREFDQATASLHGDRIFQCTSADFASFDLPYLVELLRYNEVNEVVLQIDGNLDLYLKYAELLDLVYDEDLGIRFSINSSDIDSLSMDELDHALSMSLIPLVHLDLSGFENREELGLYEKVRQLLELNSRSLDITATFPASIPDSLIATFQPHLKALHISTGSEIPAPGLFQKISDLKAMGYADIRIQVRARHFDSRLHMDNYISELIRHLDINRVCIEGIKDLLSQEMREIGWHEER